MIVIAGLGLVLLVAGVLMGLAQGFIDYLPYSLYFSLVVILVVGVGIYAINRSSKNN